MSPGAPDSPDRSCQEPASTVRRHEQFADVSTLLIYNINILANYKADFYYREGVIYKYKLSKAVY